jgi:hypothetical protein
MSSTRVLRDGGSRVFARETLRANWMFAVAAVLYALSLLSISLAVSCGSSGNVEDDDGGDGGEGGEGGDAAG